MTTTIYTVTDENGRDCSKCTATKRAMDKRGISYEVREMTAAEREAFKAAGHMSAPVVVTESESWAGFRPDKILTLAGSES